MEDEEILGAPVTLGGGCVVRALEDLRGDMELAAAPLRQWSGYANAECGNWAKDARWCWLRRARDGVERLPAEVR